MISTLGVQSGDHGIWSKRALQGGSDLSHRESQTLNCLLWKLDFYPLRLGSVFPRSTEALLEKHVALWGHEKLTAQTSCHLSDLSPFRTRLKTDPTPGWLSAGCWPAFQTGMLTAGVIYLLEPYPHFSTVPEANDDHSGRTKKCLSSLRQADMNPTNTMSFTRPLYRFPYHILCITLILTMSHCWSFLDQDTANMQFDANTSTW